jgi:hypothetical protein
VPGDLNPKPKLLIASGYDILIIELAISAAELYGLTQPVVLELIDASNLFSELITQEALLCMD